MPSIIGLLALLATLLTAGLAVKSPPPNKSPPPKSPPPNKSPPLKSPSPKSCECLTSWKFNNKMWSGCLTTGWCATSNNCASPTGYTDNGGGVVIPWITCSPMQSPPPTSPPPPGTQPCGFYRRTEDSDLINKTGGIQIWTCFGQVVPQAVRIARR